jgi:hypothetical protein
VIQRPASHATRSMRVAFFMRGDKRREWQSFPCEWEPSSIRSGQDLCKPACAGMTERQAIREEDAEKPAVY